MDQFSRNMVNKKNSQRRRGCEDRSDSFRDENGTSGYIELKCFLEQYKHSDIKKKQLRAKCLQHGLSKRGNKQELLQKLNRHLPTLQRKLNTENVKVKIEQPLATSTPDECMDDFKMERKKIVLWRRPFLTLYYFSKEVVVNSQTYSEKFLNYRKSLISGFFLLCSWFILKQISGPHQLSFQWCQEQMLWCLYWLGLGILSSVGLGSGLHTFLLYLGPHIARVTLAAHECGSLNFPEPPYPDEILCPSEIDDNYATSIWNIICKVKLEAIMWGAGTALGELPPYFMAKASRLSEYDVDDDSDEQQLCFIKGRMKTPEKKLSLVDRWKLMIETFVHRVGFFGILACASIPNPLFDLAGITCGHFLVPFWTFFGATLIGKAVIKISVQAIVVIIAFNESLISKIMNFLTGIPFGGATIQGFISEFLAKEKRRLHQNLDSLLETDSLESTLISKAFELFVLSMVVYFVISVINSMAQTYYKRLSKLNPKSL